jgi:hypothetical protein
MPEKKPCTLYKCRVINLLILIIFCETVSYVIKNSNNKSAYIFKESCEINKIIYIKKIFYLYIFIDELIL